MRLIDADKLYPDCLTKYGRVAISHSQIANATTVEEPERPKGEWIIAFHDCIGRYYLCSCCKEGRAVINGVDYLSLDEFEFCPHCGAEMQKGGAPEGLWDE